jgi:O-methyltransferase
VGLVPDLRRVVRWLKRQIESVERSDLGAPSRLLEIASYSLATPEILLAHYFIARDEALLVPGDLVECGVLNGGSAAAMALALRDTAKRAWLYDSFAGMPEPSDRDGTDARQFAGACVGSEEMVYRALATVGFERSRAIVRKGWFSETFKLPLPERVSILHVDADWYDSVILALDTFYDRVSVGGVIILDDFGHWEGCREAYYDFVARRGIRPLLERFGHTQAFWVKERTHNRTAAPSWPPSWLRAANRLS